MSRRGSWPVEGPAASAVLQLLCVLLVLMMQVSLGQSESLMVYDRVISVPYAARLSSAQYVPYPMPALSVAATESLTFPHNVTSVFKGKWSSNSSLHGSLSGLTKDSGKVLYRLESYLTSLKEPAVHYVEGVMSLKNGDSSTDSDVNLRLRGLYFPSTGRLILYTYSDTDDDDEDENDAETNRVKRHYTTETSTRAAQELMDRMKAPVHTQGTAVGNDADGFSLCSANLEFQLRPIPIKDALKQDSGEDQIIDMDMTGNLVSNDCNLQLTLTASVLRFDVFYDKVGNYILIVIGLSLAQIILIVRQMQDSSSPARATRISLATVAMQALIDSSLCLLHLFEGILMADPLFQAFVATSFFQFFIFSVFELRLLLHIWKARRPEAFNSGWEVMRQEFSMLYTRFYGFIVLSILILYQTREYLYITMFFVYSFWIPQIINNAQLDASKTLSPRYIIGMSVSRLFVPLYVYGCPVNFFTYQVAVQPRYGYCIALVIWMAIQISVLFLQDKWGPRFFVPARFLPPKFNYHQLDAINRDLELAEDNPCPICYIEFDRNASARDLMRTPCNHLFHTECLVRWMDQKMECPTCRAPLPSL